ncbi:MAG: hypothetical protein B7X65_16005 [Polaromonas sp. 39-63-25]|jgi:hypothetical protein|nr:MAG: hypothetical protein B7Y60_16280 [Polaromonas sp. 35-63-35]OYZ17847.1 MAG: hypothetical protein B7Y28_17970 [Polaromonas sp. 16-63-31]OYZ77245.1 MAG: hypothetical protein B7Y09_17315 [Polaromonas sp. 24-63-21]OZA48177.1 MAG: hypothetical protein B7X88_19345 [Polaromonas sp. 17-63-33]OZA86703.1 MAG: hypothetical protein B7X65_16005 [Polaromonas sp. 39-63-25]
MKKSPSLTFALFFIAVSALSMRAYGQNDTRQQSGPASPAVAASCPPVQQFKPAQIHGTWRARFTPAPAGLPADATLQLQRHAEFSESVAGFVNRELAPTAGKPAQGGHAARAQLAGDLEDGYLTLDESSNGISITGAWNGKMVEGTCGRKITGTWKDMSSSAPPDAPDVPFTLERLSGW